MHKVILLALLSTFWSILGNAQITTSQSTAIAIAIEGGGVIPPEGNISGYIGLQYKHIMRTTDDFASISPNAGVSPKYGKLSLVVGPAIHLQEDAWLFAILGYERTFHYNRNDLILGAGFQNRFVNINGKLLPSVDADDNTIGYDVSITGYYQFIGIGIGIQQDHTCTIGYMKLAFRFPTSHSSQRPCGQCR